MKKLLLSFCTLLLLASVCVAQSTAAQPQGTPADISKKFFEIYSTKPMDAIDFIFSGEKNSKDLKESITSIKKNLNATINIDGGYNGYELITEKNVGSTLKLMSYMAKYDKQPVRFVFIYYKPKDVWKVYTFEFNTNMDDELNVAAGVDRLKENKE
ncbi:MAG: hypothetical protein ABI203_01545 [Mucilaginibacter sp.]